MPITIGVLKETVAGETRVAISPEVAGKFAAAGARIVLQTGAGVRARFPDADYEGVEFAGRRRAGARRGRRAADRAAAAGRAGRRR